MRGKPFSYFEAPVDPKAKWQTETISDRADATTTFDYVDPDGSAGDVVETTVTDAESNATFYRMDGFGRPVESVNVKGETTQLGWDADHNVIELVEDNGATTTSEYDSGAGYPLSIADAEANANGTAGTVLGYDLALDGHVADLVSKTSPDGRVWEFGYDGVGNLTSVTDPAGTATGEAGDYTTSYAYSSAGLLETATDANGNTTAYSGFGPTGYPTIITDAHGNATDVVYDERGLVTSVEDAEQKVSSFSYDVFGRPLETQVPKDQASDVFIVTPAPVYDANDNVVQSTGPNGAVTIYEYDAADRMSSTTLPKDEAGDPDRITTFEYDLVGNVVAQTEPNGTLTAADPNDFVTRYGYDSIYQLTAVTNAEGEELTYGYDSVGNVVEVVDPRKNTTTDPDDVTMSSAYDLNHRVTSTTDAAGETASTSYDLDGLVVESTDKEGSTTEIDYDPRGLVSEVRVPHDDAGGEIEYRTTRYAYDEAGNRVRVLTPRGVETTEPDDPVFNTPEKVTYGYDLVGNLTSVSAPPSDGQSVRNETTFTHFDNGWVASSTDPWGLPPAMTTTSWANRPCARTPAQVDRRRGPCRGRISRTARRRDRMELPADDPGHHECGEPVADPGGVPGALRWDVPRRDERLVRDLGACRQPGDEYDPSLPVPERLMDLVAVTAYDSVLGGVLKYTDAEHSFSFVVGSSVDLLERSGRGGVTSMSIGTLQIEVGIETGMVLFVWGLHPRVAWQLRPIGGPSARPGVVRIAGDSGLKRGVSVQLAPVGGWSTEFDASTGWVHVTADQESSNEEQVLVATGTVLGIQGGQLNSLWLQPIFD